MSGPVAVVGAGGFVGARMLEMRVLGSHGDVVPVVRGYKSVGRSSRLGISHRIADAARLDALRPAIAGCDAVVNLTTGHPAAIPEITRTVHAACAAEGVRLLVHLSSAVVYGRAEQPGIPDDAAPLRRHWMAYARAKAEAEHFLRSTLAGPVAVVVLRPGLVWGPGSPWVLGPATALAAGRAYLVGDGAGVCNLVYVDNLVRAIEAVITRRPAAAGFYHVGDEGVTTWRDYYAALAGGLGLDPAAISSVTLERYRVCWRDRLEALQESALYLRLKGRVPDERRKLLKAWLSRLSAAGRRPPAPGDGAAAPRVTREAWSLQTTRYPLPTRKFAETFGRHQWDPFPVAMARTLAWLRFVGFGTLEGGGAEADAPEEPLAERVDAHAGGR